MTSPELPSYMSFVTPMVAVGDRGVALDRDLVRLHGIEAILSLAPLVPARFIGHHLQLVVADRVPLPSEAIDAAVAFIDGNVRDGRRVLMHCEMGISRSPALAVCYLHQCQGMSVDEALDHVRFVRPTAAPHPELMGSIRRHYEGRRAPAAGDHPGPPVPVREVE